MTLANFPSKLTLFVIIVSIAVIFSYSSPRSRPLISISAPPPTRQPLPPPSPLPQPTLPLPTFAPGESGQVNLPPLPSGFNWQPVSSPSYEPYPVYLNTKSPADPIYQPITPTGKVYSVSRATTGFPSPSLFDGFVQTKYFESLEKTGWQYQIDFGPYQISAPAADGPTGSINGLVKRSGFIVRTIAYHWSFQSTSIKPLEEGGLTCPCSETLEVLVSDPIDLRGHLPL